VDVISLNDCAIGLRQNMKTYIRNNRGFLLFLILFGVFRTAIADWNPIPSGSMRPNLLEGDVVFVNRVAYDLKVPLTNHILTHFANPKRGDIVTFFSPKDGTRLIKRIVAIPGDVVEMHDKRVIVNGIQDRYAVVQVVSPSDPEGTVQLNEIAVDGSHIIQWVDGSAGRNNFDPIHVPTDQYLMLGDNRDNSADSRYFGFVPRHLLIGQAKRILVSVDITSTWRPRTDRFGMPLK
jgi:signal peptidase I